MAEQEEDTPSLLLVDDDVTFCSVLKQALEKRQFRVFVAHNLDTAKALLEQVEPDNAVIDLRIGPESGLVLVKHLVALYPTVSIVMLTGYASIATAVEAVKLGAIHYLAKPADADEIVSALTRGDGDVNTALNEHPLSVKRLEWEHLQKVMLEHEGNISAAARALGMHRRTLQRKLEKRPVKD